MRSIRRMALAATVATAALVLAAPAVAQAETGANAVFGQHVHACTQTMGFSGSHHPGMHHGNAGWDGMPSACPST